MKFLRINSWRRPFVRRFRCLTVSLAAVAGLIALPAALSAQTLSSGGTTTIEITNTVLVPDTERMGIHFGGDNFYDSVILKTRVADNFEGGVKRQHILGSSDQPDPTGFYNFGFNPERQPIPHEHVGADGYILCGPDLWTKVTIADVEVRDSPRKAGEKALFYKFEDQEIRWAGERFVAGILLDWTDVSEGQHPWEVKRRKRVDGGVVMEVTVNKQYCSPENTAVVTGDTPPGVGQYAAFQLDGTESNAFYKQRVQFNQPGPFAGDWTVKLWAKATAGEPTLTVRPTVNGTRETLTPTSEWQEYTVPLTLEAAPEGRNPIFMLQVEAEGGVVLIDNLVAVKDSYLTNAANDTPFRDELFETFQYLNPGSVRYLRNTQDSLHNWILPRIENFGKGDVGDNSRSKDDFGTHEFYEFCAAIGADPWANMPGTMLLEEMDLLMEYHGGPAGTKGGDLRIRLGQEEPWTEVFDKIHLQFGNEVITFFGTGFWGPDYWSSLIERCKQSPYWDEDKFVFHLNEQGGGPSGMDDHPAFDRFTISGYHIFGLYDDQLERAGNLAGFYDFVFASAWHLWKDGRNNKWWSSLNAAAERDKEISIYEGLNYHTTFGSENPPLDRINKMLAGRAGGMSAFHSGLLLLKHWGARTQQNFNLAQTTFAPSGAFGNMPEPVRGWGGVLRIGSSEDRRYRPRFVAHHIANQVMGGDLVETIHSGADPKYDITNRFGAGYGPSRKPVEMTIEDIPRIHSYAFKEGDRRGVILVSNDPRNTQPIELKFPGGVADNQAKAWWLHSEGLEDTNEHDWEPEGPAVTVMEREIPFASGQSIQLPPATLLAIEWNEAG